MLGSLTTGLLLTGLMGLTCFKTSVTGAQSSLLGSWLVQGVKQVGLNQWETQDAAVVRISEPAVDILPSEPGLGSTAQHAPGSVIKSLVVTEL